MRYQELRKGRAHLESATAYLEGLDIVPVTALVVLEEALASIRAELRHPERFNTDGTARMQRVFTGDRATGTFPPARLDVSASRQVRRATARALGFNQMSFPIVTAVESGLTDDNGQPIMARKSGKSPSLPRKSRKAFALKARVADSGREQE